MHARGGERVVVGWGLISTDAIFSAKEVVIMQEGCDEKMKV
jgi:hypothetical protein